MVVNGRQQFIDATGVVMELGVSKRVKANETTTKDLMSRLRIGFPNDDDTAKLLSLDLDNIERRHGIDTVKAIQDKAMHLFCKNAKRTKQDRR